MRRSGSVLQYHIARDAITELNGIDLGWMRWQDFDSAVNTYDGKVNMAAVKTHTYFPEHCPTAKQIVAENRYKVITIHRDLRDVVASSKRMWKMDLIQDLRAIQHEFNSWSALENALVTRYESIVHFVYLEVARIRRFLGADDSPRALQKVSWKYERENMRKLQDEDADEEGYSHKHHMWAGHVGSGNVGRWRKELSEQELAQIDAIAGNWQQAHGYTN